MIQSTNCQSVELGSIYCCIGCLRWLHQSHQEVEQEVQGEDQPHHCPPPPPPPLGPPGPVGPVGLAGPPSPPPAGATLLAQLVAAMQAAVARLPAPGPVLAPPPSRVKISPPIFKGLPGERPEAHLLRANDWMDTYNILPINKPANFKHTLDHLAREWYDSLQQRFSQYSTQGRSF